MVYVLRVVGVELPYNAQERGLQYIQSKGKGLPGHFV